MPIAVTANSLQLWPSPSKQRLFLTRSAMVGQVCRTRLTTERVIDFSIFDLGGLPLSPRSPKGEMTYYPLRSTTLQNFSPFAQTIYEICVTKVFQFLAPGGLIPGPKFTKRGDDLVDSEICKTSPLYANRRPRYPLPKFLRTNSQKNKYARCPNWRISPHADRRHRK